MIDKIKALLAMAADPGASEQERETAARQAAKMMAKHQIDEYDLMVASNSDWDLIEGEATGTRRQERPTWHCGQIQGQTRERRIHRRSVGAYPHELANCLEQRGQNAGDKVTPQ